MEAIADINEALQSALEETLTKANGLPLFLTGGTAAALYSGRTVRPLSFDLDFMLSQDPRVQSEIESRFGVSFERFTQKKTFKSMKAVGKSGNACDLDFILDQEVMPLDEVPSMVLKLSLDPELMERAQTHEFEGVSVQVAPPEYIALAKLFAGRGLDIGKFDLVDAAAMFNNFEVNRFDPNFLLYCLDKFLVATEPAQHANVKARIAHSLSQIMRDTAEHKLTRDAYDMIAGLHASLIQ